jgi:glycosyltransferase involved in cell wall biosynthesis
VIYELSRRHTGRSRVIVGRGTFDGYPPYEVGEGIEVPHGRYPGRYGRVVDAVTGALGIGRPLKWRGYAAALDAILPDFEGWVFVHGEPAIVAPIRKARPKARIALYCHYELFNWYTGAEVRRVLHRCNAAICVSDHVREYVLRKAGGSIDRLWMVPNGIDTERFRPLASGVPGDPVVLYVGRMEPEKGVHLLVAACRQLKDRGVRFRLRVVGGKYLGEGSPVGPYQHRLAADAAALGDQVEFIPFVDRMNIPAVYQSAAIFCAPSIWDEPFGLTVAEAMSSGLPVVLSRRGALPVVAGDAGVYFDPPDVAALADRLAELLADEPRRRALGAAGRARALGLGWEGVYHRLTAALSQAEH